MNRVLIDGRGRFLGSATLLFCAIALGGGTAPIRDMLVELVAAALVILLAVEMNPQPAPGSQAAKLLLLLLLLVPLAQLVPLPAGIWRSLPGHDAEARIADLAGQGSAMQPLSMVPHATLAGLLSIVPGAAMFLATLRARHSERRLLMAITLAAAVASAMLGVAQVASRGDFYLYDHTHLGYPVGLFANRNHEADLLLIGLLMTAALVGGRPAGRPALRFAGPAAILLFGVAVVTTGSRMALLLFAIVLVAVLAALLSGRRGRIWLIALISAGVAVAVIALLAFNSVAQETALRFANGDEDRLAMWSDSWFAARSFLPWGSGIGSFVPVYQAVERLETVATSYVNHAHNDYVEFVLEAGVFGGLLILAYWLLLAVRLARPAPMPAAERIAIGAAILVLLLHSIVDYPIRTLALGTTFGMLNGMLFPLVPRPRRKGGVMDSPR